MHEITSSLHKEKCTQHNIVIGVAKYCFNDLGVHISCKILINNCFKDINMNLLDFFIVVAVTV